MRNAWYACSEMMRCTRAVKGMVATSPLATSRRRSLPPWAITIEAPPGAHAYPGSTRIVFIPSDMSCVMGSMTMRSAPDSRSRIQSAVLGPNSWPFHSMVASGRRRAKATWRPSGEISPAKPPPPESRYWRDGVPLVTRITSPVSRSMRRRFMVPCSASRTTSPSTWSTAQGTVEPGVRTW